MLQPCLAVKPFPDEELRQFIDRKKQGSKGKKVQERLESSLRGFHDAFTNSSEKWRKSDNWLQIIKKLQDLNDSVDSYYARLFNQALRQSAVHKSIEPVRDASVAVAYKTVEKHPTSLTIPKDLRR